MSEELHTLVLVLALALVLGHTLRCYHKDRTHHLSF